MAQNYNGNYPQQNPYGNNQYQQHPNQAYGQQQYRQQNYQQPNYQQQPRQQYPQQNYQQQPYAQYPQPRQQYPQPAPQPVKPMPDPKEKSKATAAMILGIVACVFCWYGFFGSIGLGCGIAALVLGIQTRKTIPLNYQGRGMATAGFIMGIISVIIGGLAVIGNILALVFAGTAMSFLGGFLDGIF